MKGLLLLLSLWMPVTTVASTADPAAIDDDSPVDLAQRQPVTLSQTSSSQTTGAEQVVDIHGRLIEIPSDFVVMEAAGRGESTRSETGPDTRQRDNINGSLHLYQGEQVSLEEIESTQVLSPQRLQKESTETNSLFDRSVITPDPLPASRKRVPKSESPLTGIQQVSVSTASRGSALTEYRAWTKADFDPFNTPVSWRFEPGTTVGEAVRRLAAFIGYQVSVESPQVNAVYAMRLPHVHRQVRHLKVQTAFEIIGGAGMFVVVDHRKREVAHYVKALGNAESALPGCFELGFVEWESPTTGYCSVREKRCRL